MSITTDTRFESYQKLNKECLKNEIVSVLKDFKESGLTAREVAIILYNNGIINNKERQATAPRLTELSDDGIVVVVGKKMDEVTYKNVAVYSLK